jgi:alpha-D-xyloside xylohydrolase
MSELIKHPDSIEWRFERQILRVEAWESTACARP